MVHRQNKFGTFKHKLCALGQQWIDGLLIILILVEFSNASITCGPGIYSSGITSPSGDITIEYNSGTPLEITCVLNPNDDQLQKVFSDNAADDNLLSHRIRFYRNDERVPEQYVSIINSTAAQLRVPNPPASFGVYKCMACLDKKNHFVQRSKSPGTSINSALKKYLVNTVESHPSDSHDSHDDCIGVCLNNVFIGYKPTNITSFSCISNNWESLTCNWTKPENPIKTNYKIYFRLPGRSRSIMACPTDSDVRNNTCYWDLSTTPLYRQSYEYYYITVAGQNALGKMSIPFRFHHYANIIPAEPTKIAVVDQTESSVKLLWSLGTLYFYSYGLIFKIQYKSQWDSDPEGWNSTCVSDNCKEKSVSNQNTSVQVMNCLEKDANHYSFDVTDLEYSFTRYEFCIYVRTALASEDDKWSAPGCIIANTKASIPKRPPRTDIGSFEYVISPLDKSKRDIVIYWQTIEDYEKGGESFEYIAYYIQTTADQQITTYRSNEIGKSYAKFNLLSTSIGYEFIVMSYNNEGSSTECSRVYVPSESDTLHKPESFKKNVYDEQGIFELSWKGADSQKLSTQNSQHFYTLFWCEKDLINPLQCNGYMNWMHLAISVSRYNTTMLNNMEKYIFAISVNNKNPMSNGIDKASSSGMVWESFINNNPVYIVVTIIGTVPSGDIVLEYGSGVPLEITCNLQSDTIIVQNLFHVGKDSSNTTKFPSHRIMFYKNAEIVPKQYVTIVNATAARLRIPNLPAGQGTYYCTLLLDYEHRKNESHGNSSVDIIPSYVSSTLPTVGHYVTGSNTNGSQQLGSQVGVCLNRVYVGSARKVENVWVSVISSTFIGLRWNIDCADRMGLFGEYQIYYCVAVSTKNNVCNGFMFSKTISREAAQKEEGFTLITNLEPNTTYIVSIAISTNDDKSIHSDPLQITTLGLGEDWYLKQEYPKFVATIN